MPDKEYLPYKAINVFIDQDYLESVLRNILTGIDNLPKEDQIEFAKFFRKYVTILGFRNPARAPVPLQVNAYATAFEGKDEVVPFTLSVWTRLHEDLAQKTQNWLESEGWKYLALERKYEESGGFIAEWPKKLTFDKLVKNFKKANPDVEFERNDLILMVLWVSGQLPKEQSDI